MPADTVAVVRAEAAGGDAAMMVTSGVAEVRGDALREVTGTLATQLT